MECIIACQNVICTPADNDTIFSVTQRKKEYKKQGVSAINTEGVHLENVKRNDNRTLILIEQTDELKKEIAHRNKLIRHLQGIIENKNVL